jgi:hypothetical protein
MAERARYDEADSVERVMDVAFLVSEKDRRRRTVRKGRNAPCSLGVEVAEQ